MTSILQLSVYAQTALASYAVGLQSAGSNVVRYVDPDVGMVTPQAEAFDSTWAVLQQFTSTPTIGFSAVLLQRKDASGNATGEKVLAIAGTDPSSPADLLTDLVNVAGFGTVLNMPQYGALEAFYASLVSSGKLGASEQFTVTGHSLGGFLAQAFTARHSGVVSAAYTYNAPGFSGLEILQGFLGISDLSAAGKIINVHATDGVSMTAGLGIMLGSSVPVRIEASSNPLDNHSVVRLGDALAVQEAIARLQPGLSVERLGVLFAASSLGERRLEDAVDALRTVFIDSSSNDANRTPTGDRESLHLNLNAVLDDAAYQSLVGHAQIIEGGVHFSPAAQADTQAALAYRYALLEMLPFAVVADTEADNQTLYGAHAQRLSLYDEATGQGELTREWLVDRAALLDALGARNVKNGDSQIAYSSNLPRDRSFELRWIDAQGAEQILIAENTARQGGVLGPVPNQLIRFGGDDSETLAGSLNQIGDHLYGGAGDDTLNGFAGADRLEGNSGNDTLDGGLSNDTLLGGIGNDTYDFSGSWGADTIEDAGGQGSIRIEGTPLNSAATKKVAEGVWQTDDRRFNYSLVVVDANRNDLIISFSDRPDTIRIRNWSAGQLGIDLGDTPFEPPVDSTYIGDIAKASLGNDYQITDHGYASAGAAPGAADVLNGGAGADLLQGLDGNDGIAGGAGDDVIEGGDGDDLLLGGHGADTINGGAGSDYVLGSASGRIDRPTKTDFAPPPASGVERVRGFSWVVYDPPGEGQYVVTGAGDIGPSGENDGNVIDGGAGNDFIYTGSGSDVAHGGDGNDVVVGMHEGDVLFGDAGSDHLWGDGSLDSEGSYTPDEWHGNDTLVGGAGDDQLVGQGADDALYGGDDNDTLFGDDSDGPVAIHGGDYLDGGNGADSLAGGGQSDILYGGTGDDGLWGDSARAEVGSAGYIDVAFQGDDYLDGHDGNDHLYGEGGADTLLGGLGNDTLVGDDADSRLAGALHGADYLDGGEGDDYLEGDGNADTLLGGGGNDELQGDALDLGNSPALAHGEDHLDGGQGDDRLFGGGRADSLYGGAGNDFLWGDAGSIEIGGANYLDVAHQGDDYLDGEDGDDYLQGEGGADTLLGGAGSDVLVGDDAESRLIGTAHGDDYLDGEGGNDQLAGFGGNDTLFGGIGDDLLIGDYETLTASFHGNDYLDGEDGNDQLVGNGGDDTLYGGAGNDVLLGDGSASTLESGNDGADYLDGGDGDDQLAGQGGSDSLFGGSGNDGLQGGSGDDILDGGEGLDTLSGGMGADNLFGGLADDILSGGSGDDVIDGGGGNDTLHGDTGNNVYRFGKGGGQDALLSVDDAATGKLNVLEFGPGVAPSEIVLRRIFDPVYGSNMALELSIAGTDDKIAVFGYLAFANPYSQYNPVQMIRFADGTTWDVEAVKTRLLAGTDGTDTIVGTAGADVIDGGEGNDTIQGSGGNDTLIGGAGNDMLTGANGNDILSGGEGNDVLVAYGSNDLLYGGAGDDGLVGGAGDDTLSGDAGNDTLVSGTGNDTYVFGRGDGTDTVESEFDVGSIKTLQFKAGIAPADIVLKQVFVPSGSYANYITLEVKIAGTTDSISLLRFFEGADPANPYSPVQQFKFDDGTTWDLAAINARLFEGTNEDDIIVGTVAGDVIHGGTGADYLLGGDGGDTLEGGAGADALEGGHGNNTYLFGRGDGDDFIFGRDADSTPGKLNSLQFRDGVAPEDIFLVQFEGYSLRVILSDNGGSVTIEGYFRNDSPLNDYNPVQQFRFADGTTWDISAINARLFEGTSQSDLITGTPDSDMIRGGVGDDILAGLAGNDSLFGDEDSDVLDGGDGDDTLDGGTGSDLLVGGLGNNIFRFARGGGQDTVFADVYTAAEGRFNTLRFEAGISPADLILRHTSAAAGDPSDIDLEIALNGTSDRVLVRNFFADDDPSGSSNPVQQLAFSDGTIWNIAQIVDHLFSVPPGTSGNDTLNGGDGNDSLVGLGGDDVLNGFSGNDTLDGGAGVDNMAGGTGNDVYYVDNAGDLVLEAESSGHDRVYSSVSFVLPDNVEDLSLTEGSASVATGNALANSLLGNASDNTLDGGADDDYLWGGDGADVLSGGAGADYLEGGTGNDRYVVDNSWDEVYEEFGQGIDTVESSVTWTLGADFENLTLTGTGVINGTGNALNNVLTGNGAANVLKGGAGNDTYVVGTGDTVTEAASAGTDTVQSSITWTLGSNLEDLTLTGMEAANGTGNTLNNTLTGNAGDNTLNGGTGIDTMVGGAGNDTYVVDSTSDVVTEQANEGADLVQSSVTYTLAANVEHLTLTGTGTINGTGNTLSNVLTGNGANNILNGGAGNDTLDGGAGTDTMVGGAGNDTYVVNVTTDVVTESANGGTDTVQSGVTLTLGNNVENLTLTGSSAISGTGNALDNVLTGNGANNTLTGNAGNDTLDGGAGTDTMRGGAGDDIYVVERSADIVTESASQGTDTVRSSVTWTLGSNLENLTLTGTAAINGIGNSLNNVLIGNAAANTLAGAAGNDSYAGGAGNDVLNDTSTTSNDVYAWGRGEGVDTLTDAGGSDRLDILAGATEEQIWLRRIGNHLELSVIGTGDRFTVNNWYSNTANRVESFRLADGQALQASKVQQLVDAMAAFAPPAAGQTTLPPDNQSTLQPVIAANWV